MRHLTLLVLITAVTLFGCSNEVKTYLTKVDEINPQQARDAFLNFKDSGEDLDALLKSVEKLTDDNLKMDEALASVAPPEKAQYYHKAELKSLVMAREALDEFEVALVRIQSDGLTPEKTAEERAKALEVLQTTRDSVVWRDHEDHRKKLRTVLEKG